MRTHPARPVAPLAAALALLAGACASFGDPVLTTPRIQVLDKPDVTVEVSHLVRSSEDRWRGMFFGSVPDGSSARVTAVGLELWNDLDQDGELDAGERRTSIRYESSVGYRTYRQPYVAYAAPPTRVVGRLTVTTTENTYEVPLVLPTE